MGCNPPQSRDKVEDNKFIEKLQTTINESTNLKEEENLFWESLEEYNKFVRSTVNNYYASDVKEIYYFYNIKRDLPKYGFKLNKNGIRGRSEMDRAEYKEKMDSIYFYSTDSEELFRESIRHLKNNKENIEEYLTNRVHHAIKHEAAHAYYYSLAKELGENYLLKIDRENSSFLYYVQQNLVSEGVAEYISYKGEFPKSVNLLNNDGFFSDDRFKKKVIKGQDDSHFYNFGFALVKPILDINFQRGIEELIKNPLTKKDLNDLLGYRNRRINNLMKK